MGEIMHTGIQTYDDELPVHMSLKLCCLSSLLTKCMVTNTMIFKG